MKRILILILVSANYLLASESTSLVLNGVSHEEHGLAQIDCDLAHKMIGSYVLKGHPIVEFILQHVKF